MWDFQNWQKPCDHDLPYIMQTAVWLNDDMNGKYIFGRTKACVIGLHPKRYK